MKLGGNFISNSILGLVILYLTSQIKPLQTLSDYLTAIGIALFLSLLITYILSFLGRSRSIWFGALLGALIGYSLDTLYGCIVGLFLGLVIDYGVSKYYHSKQLEKHFHTFRKFGSFIQARFGFLFGGGKSGGGGSSGNW